MKKSLFVISILFALNAFSQKYIQFLKPNAFNHTSKQSNSTDTIFWNSRSVNNIKIDYCLNYNIDISNNIWTTIIGSTPSSPNYYIWNIPNISGRVRLRVSDASNQNYSDLCDVDIELWNPVTSAKSLTFEGPIGGEDLESGSNYFNISIKNQNVTDVVFDFSDDNGQSWERIETLSYYESDVSSCSFSTLIKTFNWEIPNGNHPQCKLRVYELNNPSVFDETGVFSISNNISKKIEMEYPNNFPSYLPMGGSTTVSWNATGITTARLEYTDNFIENSPTTWTLIGDYPASNGQAVVNFPSFPYITGRFRISDASDQSVYDINDHDYYVTTVTPFEMTLTSPSDGTVWDSASKYNNITWTYQGNIQGENLEFQFSYDNGANWATENNFISNGTNYSFNNSSYLLRSVNWDVPNVISNQCKLRIIDKNSNNVITQSGVFSIGTNLSKYIELKSVNGGQIAVDSTYHVSWNSTGINNVKIEYAQYFNNYHNLTNNWNVYSQSTPANQDSISFVESNTNSSFYRWRVSDADGSSNQTYFSEDFSSGSLGQFTATDSDGDGENWEAYDFQTGNGEGYVATSASWSSVTGLPLNPDNWLISSSIDLSLASGNIELSWKVMAQDQQWPNENYSVYVASSNGISDFTSSNTFFTEVLSSSNGYMDRSIDISSFVGSNIYVAFRHHNCTDMFQINIDDIEVSSISSGNSNTAFDISDGDITIYDNSINPRTLDIVYPNGQEIFLGGRMFQNISWKSTYLYENISFQLSTDDGANWSNITPYVEQNCDNNTWITTPPNAFSNKKSINFITPNISSDDCRIRIVSDGINISDISDQTFSIVYDNTVDIKDLNNSKINLYPNPSNEEINISFTNKKFIGSIFVIYNYSGKIVDTGVLKDLDNKIILNEYSNGFYFVKISSNKQNSLLKFMKH